MEASEFVAVYAKEYVETGPDVPELATARTHANNFGTVIHEYLQPDNTASFETLAGGPTALKHYTNWCSGLDAIYNGIPTTQGTETYFKHLTELTYHRLNLALVPMYMVLGDQRISATDHAKLRRLSIDTLGMIGLHFLRWREGSADDPAYFSSEGTTAAKRSYVEGVLNEIDAGIVLLNVIRDRPDVAVIPAPAQFEHGKTRAYNSDFLVIDRRGYATGVQVKSHVSDDDTKTYDHNRVVLVSGQTDMGNVLAKRTRPNSSLRQQVSWAGMLSAHVVARQTSLVGPDAGLTAYSTITAGGRQAAQRLILRRHFARQLLGGITPNMKVATGNISERVLRSLYQGAPPNIREEGLVKHRPKATSAARTKTNKTSAAKRSGKK